MKTGIEWQVSNLDLAKRLKNKKRNREWYYNNKEKAMDSVLEKS